MSIKQNKPKKRYHKSSLTPAKKKFAKVYAKTDNATEAVRQAYPEIATTTSDSYLSTKGNRLMTNDAVQLEIQYQKNAMAMLASRAVNRIGKLIDSEDEGIAGTNARYAYDQVQGKATQRTETVGIQFTATITKDGYNI